VKRILLVLTFLIISLYACNWTPAPAAAQAGMYVEVLNSRVPLLRAQDDGCYFGNTFKVYLNRPGECGRPADAKNVFLVYGHNFSCDAVYCPFSRDGVDVGVWPALVVGDKVRLFDGKRLWHGVVIEVIPDANAKGIENWYEFPCSTGVCGTLTTCSGLRPSWTVVRVIYR
jgi:hypothetical protein